MKFIKEKNVKNVYEINAERCKRIEEIFDMFYDNTNLEVFNQGTKIYARIGTDVFDTKVNVKKVVKSALKSILKESNIKRKRKKQVIKKFVKYHLEECTRIVELPEYLCPNEKYYEKISSPKDIENLYRKGYLKIAIESLIYGDIVFFKESIQKELYYNTI